MIFDRYTVPLNSIFPYFYKQELSVCVNGNSKDCPFFYVETKFTGKVFHVVRSIIFTNGTEESRLAAVSKEREQIKSKGKIVTTEIKQLGTFYPAEPEHQVYYPPIPISFFIGLTVVKESVSTENINF